MHKQTMTQCCVVCPNDYETYSKVTQCLYKEGVNVEAMNVESVGSMYYMRFMCENYDSASLRTKLESYGCRYMEDQVSYFEMPNQQGELAKLAKALYDEKIYVRYMYGCSYGKSYKMVLCCDKAEAAARIVKEYYGAYLQATPA